MNNETERKYLIEYPDISLLEKRSTSIKRITQTYLCSERETDRRVRRSECEANTVFTFTEKRNLTRLTRLEDEREITEEEYEAYLLSADENFAPISKTRYCVPAPSGQTAEIDVYLNITAFAVCEVELCDENEKVVLPDCIKLVREVTGEKEYSNRQIARIK